MSTIDEIEDLARCATTLSQKLSKGAPSEQERMIAEAARVLIDSEEMRNLLTALDQHAPGWPRLRPGTSRKRMRTCYSKILASLRQHGPQYYCELFATTGMCTATIKRYTGDLVESGHCALVTYAKATIVHLKGQEEEAKAKQDRLRLDDRTATLAQDQPTPKQRRILQAIQNKAGRLPALQKDIKQWVEPGYRLRLKDALEKIEEKGWLRRVGLRWAITLKGLEQLGQLKEVS